MGMKKNFKWPLSLTNNVIQASKQNRGFLRERLKVNYLPMRSLRWSRNEKGFLLCGKHKPLPNFKLKTWPRSLASLCVCLGDVYPAGGDIEMGLVFRLIFFFSVAPHKVPIRCSLRIGTSQEAVREEALI